MPLVESIRERADISTGNNESLGIYLCYDIIEIVNRSIKETEQKRTFDIFKAKSILIRIEWKNGIVGKGGKGANLRGKDSDGSKIVVGNRSR